MLSAAIVTGAAAQGWDTEFGLDQRFSIRVSPQTFFLLRLGERGNENVSHLAELFVEMNAGFHVKPWLTIIPGFIHLRLDPLDADSRFENRPQLAFQMQTRRGRWRPTARVAVEGRFLEADADMMRILLRPGAEYEAHRFRGRAVIFWAANEFGFDTRSDRYSRNSFQTGLALPVGERFSLLPYYLTESVLTAEGWDHDNVVGMSLWWRL